MLEDTMLGDNADSDQHQQEILKMPSGLGRSTFEFTPKKDSCGPGQLHRASTTNTTAIIEWRIVHDATVKKKSSTDTGSMDAARKLGMDAAINT